MTAPGLGTVAAWGGSVRLEPAYAQEIEGLEQLQRI